MLSTIKKISYDTLSIAAVVGYVAFNITAPILSPLYAVPVFVYAAAKTAYHAANFFHFKKYPDQYNPEILLENYKNKKHKFKKQDLNGLQRKLEAFEHQSQSNLYWIYTCKAAKAFIPIIGYIWLLKGKTAETSFKPQDTWSDINALKYHIRHLK